MPRRRSIQILLSLLALFLLGTVLVLSSISIYLSIDPAAFILPSHLESINSQHLSTDNRIPRILHQTWKSDVLPQRWTDISQQCRDIMPDYEYMLWTDSSSREFIAKQYPWFLDTFDAYTYPIQRADAIRYFILHHYGGVYLDLDVGCRRRLDPLLVYPVILPKTIPVGVSNDIMFAEKGHPFMAQTIHNLVTFDHSWILNYPTVMFSTGPMFLSAQYGIWTSSHQPTPDQPGGEVRILPKVLYGKNIDSADAPDAFFEHFYGSSWHADDAPFISFLGNWGKALMWVALVVLVMGSIRLLWQSHSKRRDSARPAGFEILLPRSYRRNGRWHIDFSRFDVMAGFSDQSPPSSPASTTSEPSSSIDEDSISVDVLSLPLHSRSSTPSPTDSSPGRSRSSSAMDAIYWAGSQVMAYIPGVRSPDLSEQQQRSSRRSWRNKGVLFYLPAIFAGNAPPVFELGTRSRRRSISRRVSSHAVSLSSVRTDSYEKRSSSATTLPSTYLPLYHSSSRSRSRSPSRDRSTAAHSSRSPDTQSAVPPPPYTIGHETKTQRGWDGEHSWDEWHSR